MRKHRPTIRDHSAEANLFARRAFVGFVFVTILVAVLLSNLYTIQVDDHQDYQTRSNDNRIKVIPIAPNRGLIYDRNGVLLAENKPVYNLEVIPEEVDDLDASLSALTQYIDISEQQKSDFIDDIKHNRRFKSQVLKARLTELEVARFSVNQHKFPGFSIEARLARYYPFADTLTHASIKKNSQNSNHKNKALTIAPPMILANWVLKNTMSSYCMAKLAHNGLK